MEKAEIKCFAAVCGGSLDNPVFTETCFLQKHASLTKGMFCILLDLCGKVLVERVLQG